MKLTKSILKELIKEEIEASLEEQEMRGIGTLTPIKPKFPGDEGQYDRSTKERLQDEYDSLAIRRRRLVKKLDAVVAARKKNPDNPELSKQIVDYLDEIDDVTTRMIALKRKIDKQFPTFGEPSAFPMPPKVKDKYGLGVSFHGRAYTPQDYIAGFDAGVHPDRLEYIRRELGLDALPKLKKIKESTLRTIIREVLEGMV